MATASATLNNPLGTSNNALTTSDGSSTGTSMVTSGTPLRSNDLARSVANTALSDPHGHGARFGATTHGEKSSAHHRDLDGGGGFWIGLDVNEDA